MWLQQRLVIQSSEKLNFKKIVFIDHFWGDVVQRGSFLLWKNIQIEMATTPRR